MIFCHPSRRQRRGPSVILPVLVAVLLTSTFSWAYWASWLILTPEGFEKGRGNLPSSYEQPLVQANADGSFEVRIKVDRANRMGKPWHLVKTSRRLTGKERELESKISLWIGRDAAMRKDIPRLNELEEQARNAGKTNELAGVRKAKQAWVDQLTKLDVTRVAPLPGFNTERREIRFVVPAAEKDTTYLFNGGTPQPGIWVSGGGARISVDLPAFMDQAIVARRKGKIVLNDCLNTWIQPEEMESEAVPFSTWESR